jgi:hypothetical protein
MGPLAKFAMLAAQAALQALMKPTPKTFAQQMNQVIKTAAKVRR